MTEQNPRGTQRLGFGGEVGIRRSGSHGYRVRIYDASAKGCRIEFVERPSVGERVWVRFDGLESVEGVVRWVEGHVGGVEFSHPLHGVVFDKLAGGPKTA
jgi:hypothetical protein